MNNRVTMHYLTTIILSYFVGRVIEDILIAWHCLSASALVPLRLGTIGISLGPISGSMLVLGLLAILKMRERIINLLRLPIAVLNVPVYWLSTAVPKKKNLWLFSSRQGDAFAENSRYLFEYTVKHCPAVEAVWITKSWRIVWQLRRLDYPVRFAYSPMGYWTSLRAACVFISNFRKTCADYNDFATGPDTAKIQLWHGSPMKRIGEARIDTDLPRLALLLRKMLRAIFPFYRNRTSCHKMLAASPIVASALSAAFNLDPEHIWVAGYPKNDRWLSNATQGKSGAENSQKRRSVIYMPTWRKEDPQLFTRFNFDLERMNRTFEASNIHFYIKMHHFSVAELRAGFSDIDNLSNVHILDVDDIYQCLDDFDMLVTDYSSILFDYLLADRPVVFAPFDYDDYTKIEVGFLSDYSELTPGLCAKDWQQLEEHILTAFDVDDFSEQRQSLCKKYNSQPGAESCKQIVKLTQELMAQPVRNKPAFHQ